MNDGRTGSTDGIEPGTKLGDFEIVGLIARGGMGEVYQARQLSLRGREVALKVLRKDLTNERNFARLEREAAVLARLQHPNLVEVYAFSQQGERALFTMRLVRGSTLQDVLFSLRATTEEDRVGIRRSIVRWAAEVADALALVHASGLVHRDVKPANVILEDSAPGRIPVGGRAILVDFGLARSVEELTQATSAATVAYAAPEQLLGGQPGPPADVFALGVTLHDLLSVRLPSERLQASLGLEPLHELVPGIDADLVAIVGKAADPAAAWRYRDAAELRDDLRAWLQGKAVSARHPPFRDRLRRWASQNAFIVLRSILLVAAAAVCLAFVGSFVAWSKDGARARRAADRVDLHAFSDSLGEFPAWLDRLLLWDGEYVELARRVRAAASTDPLTEILLLDRTDHAAGLAAAAALLRVDGLEHDAWVTRFLFEALGRELAQRPRIPGWESRSPALFYVARLFHERPDQTPRDRELSASFRTCLRASFPLLGTDRGEDRLYVLAALAGCGSWEDFGWILALGHRAPEGSELRRMSLTASEYVLRRSQSCGGVELIDFAAADQALVPLARRVWADPRAALVDWACLDLLEALGFCARRVGAPLPLLRATAFGEEKSLVSRSRFLAALGDSELPTLLRSGLTQNWSQSSWRWGTIAGALGNAGLLKELEQSLTEDGSMKAVSDFRAGVQAGVEARSGERVFFPPDADTLLESRGGDPAPVRVSFDEQEPARVDRAVATWDFTSIPPRKSGVAGETTHRFATHMEPIPDENRPEAFLRLFRFGESEVDLAFEITAGVLRNDWLLEIVQVSARRNYVPFGGEAYYEVWLDDKLLGLNVLSTTKETTPANSRPHSHLLPAGYLADGSHLIRIVSHPRTTTTHRIYRVAIRALE